LVDATTFNPDLPAGNPFTNVQTAGPGYWSATTDGVFSFAAWIIFFGSGSYSSGNKENPERVWCVRGAMNADVY
jgi:hypothetical protein